MPKKKTIKPKQRKESVSEEDSGDEPDYDSEAQQSSSDDHDDGDEGDESVIGNEGMREAD